MSRRTWLGAMAGLSVLQACGGGADADEAEPEDVPACAGKGSIVSSSTRLPENPTASDYFWTELVSTNRKLREPLPVMDGPGLISFQDHLWLIRGWWPPAAPVREVVGIDGVPVEKLKRHPDGSVVIGQQNLFPAQGFAKRCTNAVWRSTDGINWVNVRPDTYNTPGFDPDSDWEGRHTFGCVVFKGRMWIVGGDEQARRLDLPPYSETTPMRWDIAPQSDIWSSADGSAWRKEGNLPFKRHDLQMSTRVLGGVIVFDDALWLLGGYQAEGDATSFNDVWKSTDGRTWIQVLANESAPRSTRVGEFGRWAPRSVHHHVAVFQKRLWIVGGFVYQGTEFNDVWSSADGVNWRKEMDEDDTVDNAGHRWVGRSYGEVATFNNRLWLFTGSSRKHSNLDDYWNLGDVWSTRDGRQWTKSSQSVPPRHASGVAIHRKALHLVAGHAQNDSWMLKAECR